MLQNPRFFLGIDPGLTGAFALYDAQEQSVIDACMIPTLVLQRNRKHKRTLDIGKLIVITRNFRAKYASLLAVLELVNANPMHGRRQGTSSMFNFGETNGAIKAALAAAEIPFQKVPPTRWKPLLGCTADKEQTLERASILMPKSISLWTPTRKVRTKEECKGVAEAALLALYGATYLADPQLMAA